MQTLPAKRLCILRAPLLEVAPTFLAAAVTYLQFPIHVCLYAMHDDKSEITKFGFTFSRKGTFCS